MSSAGPKHGDVTSYYSRLHKSHVLNFARPGESMTRASTICFAVALVVVGVLGGSTVGMAHDLNGLMRRKSLPADVREALEVVERIRNVLGPARPNAAEIAASPTKLEGIKQLGLTGTSAEALEGVFDARALWRDQERLRICFIDGHAHGRASFMRVAQEIIGHTNLSVDPVVRQCAAKDRADIRISFRLGDGYWSYVGTDAARFAKAGEATMGLDRLDMLDPTSEEWLGIMRHEMMHAIGAMHEHQHPDSGCEAGINKDNVRKELGWSEVEINTNFKQLVWGDYIISTERRKIIGSSYDPQSIMHYKLPPHYFFSGEQHKCYLPMKNTKLSEGDIAMLRKLYPKR